MISRNLTNKERSRLMRAARRAVKQAYAPYSKFKVGAAVLTEKGRIYSGCNVENVSYGLTICAERSAIFSAVGKEGGDKMRIRAIVVFTKEKVPCAPCGACRQVIYEFGPEAIVIYQGSKGLVETSIPRILPEAFGD
ncbi:cytidine deaminase [bacterium]|nr:cytidine deaminase [bacterium]